MNAEQMAKTMADIDQYFTFTLDNEVFALNICISPFKDLLTYPLCSLHFHYA